MRKYVEAKCNICGKTQVRVKGHSGIPCVNGGVYCGVMHVVRYLEGKE